MSRWIVENNILCYAVDDSNPVIPSAASIFNLVFGEFVNLPEVPEETVSLPETDIPGIKFSRRYPKFCGHVFFQTDFKIILEFSVKLGPEYISVTGESLKHANHIVFENVWHSLQEAKEIVESILEESGISDAGPISLADYLNLRKIIQNYSQIIEWTDDADPEKIVKNLDRNTVKTPQKFTGNLYPYQKDGFFWLKHFTDGECGCILGDEMGLGKTIQIIALIVSRREKADSPVLVVCPVSLLENWRREISKFSVGLKVFTYHGKGIVGVVDCLRDFDVVLTTYGAVSSYFSILNKIVWDLVILDEAQYIKNPKSQRAVSVKTLRKKCGIAVTGTPYENALTDIWSITDFVFPNYLGPLQNFSELKWFESKEVATYIEPYIRPILLRRRVQEVAQDLPGRIDIPIYLEMDPTGAKMYEDIRQDEIKRNPNHFTFPMLLHLRMFCCHPNVYPGLNSDLQKSSRKYQALINIVREIVTNREKFIIFTCYNRMNDILVSDLSSTFGIQMFKITGEDDPKLRQPIVDAFSQCSESAGLILNPKAAGTGLNITAASNVIHYEPVWNPAVEDQATARAFRKGQTKIVRVYRLIYSDTVEEILDERLKYKREVSEILIVGNKGESDRSDVIKALQISPYHNESIQ